MVCRIARRGDLEVRCGREKDRTYNRAALKHGLVDLSVLLERLDRTSITEERRIHIRALIERHQLSNDA